MRSELDDMEFAVYVSTGFHYEYFMTLCASSAHAARKEFKRRYAGDHRTEDFRVSRIT
jgi:hypothetical protein